MADWEYPLEALKTAAEQKLSVVGGATARHYVGRKYVYGNHDAPRYVWVPNRGRETSDLYTVEADQVRCFRRSRIDSSCVAGAARSPKRGRWPTT
jgi:hypothetical protein